MNILMFKFLMSGFLIIIHNKLDTLVYSIFIFKWNCNPKPSQKKKHLYPQMKILKKK